MTRREFPPSVKLKAFKRANGRCEGCTAILFPGKFQYDHRLADGLGGEPTLENCQVLCTTCHSVETHEHDRPKMAKADRQTKKHAKIKRKSRSIPGSKASGWKHNMDGTWEKRE